MRRSLLASILLALYLLGALAFAQDDAAPAVDEQVEALQREVTQLEAQVASLEDAVVASNLLLAERYLTAAGFHAMDRALHEGELDPAYLQTVQTTLGAIHALHWPEGLREARDSFVVAAEELEVALREQDVEAAAEAAAQAHAREHVLTHGVFAYLASEGVGAGQAEAEHASEDDPAGAAQADTTQADTTQADTTQAEAATEASGSPAVKVPEGAESFVLAIAENGAPVGGLVTYRVERGDVVALTIRSAIPGELHLHGYDADWELHGQEVVTTFPAESTGRFPLEFHPEGSDRGIVVAYLEVHP